MNNNPIISIIVPVYNTEKFLSKCIESILNQTFKDFELILVDDGSLDLCPKICDEYAQKDARIKVIHKKNGGLSDARNAGIEAACGEYLGFVDSDDYIKENMYEVLYNLISEYQADISICMAVSVDENSEPVWGGKATTAVFNGKDALYAMIFERRFAVNSWNKLYKRELFGELRFPVGMLYEDLATTYLLLDKCNVTVCTDLQLYAYVQRGGSIMSRDNFSLSADKIKIVQRMWDYFEDGEVKIRSGIVKYILSDIYRLAGCGNLLKNEEYTYELKKFVKNHSYEIFRNKYISVKDRCILYLYKLNPKMVQKLYNMRRG